ncbi:DUF5132 domain-containing protein [Methylobacterium nodulans]|uniref:DUF5132 domain-containing protein n=1 Tax=Methylobacterium nodulans (strain LMG 21967 / CNCM I-2342 / ORS 2060) TaxID=460265 RepID=B8IRK9_METNO|nr:DUF5132 domain-containing protein [Methylobacterium nodulans]ACL60559.1 hypothetical protein Mnod_5729 [Methylobacterium nodulans ORS 2060]
MALLEDVLKGENLGAGLGIAVVGVVLAPVVLPVLRPLAKTVIKAGLIAYDQGRTALADLNERTGDILGEARAEIAEAAEARNREHTERPRRRAAEVQAVPSAT